MDLRTYDPTGDEAVIGDLYRSAEVIAFGLPPDGVVIVAALEVDADLGLLEEDVWRSVVGHGR
jgi:hypothetical protein